LLKFVLVLPTNTTCTDAKAAVAAKISTFRADVKIAKLIENRTENTMIAPSRTDRLSKEYRTNMHAVGRSEETIILRMWAVLTSILS
jgi:hypothetical protein